MGAKSMRAVRHNVTAPREKSKYLEEVCTEEQLNEIKAWMGKGAVFIVMGSEYTYTKEFYKGLHQLMYSPVFNGAAIYDSHYKFRDAFERPYIMIGLNDVCNASRIDNIKRLDRYRTKTLYTCKYEEKPRQLQMRPMDVIGTYLGVHDLSEQSVTPSPEGFVFRNGGLLPTEFWNLVAWRWFLWMPTLTTEVWEGNSFAKDSVDYTKTFCDSARPLNIIVDSYPITPETLISQYWNTMAIRQFYRVFRIVQINYAALSAAGDNYLEFHKDFKKIWRCLDESYRSLIKLFGEQIWLGSICPIDYHDEVYEKLVEMRENEVWKDDSFDNYGELDKLFDLEVL